MFSAIKGTLRAVARYLNNTTTSSTLALSNNPLSRLSVSQDVTDTHEAEMVSTVANEKLADEEWTAAKRFSGNSDLMAITLSMMNKEDLCTCSLLSHGMLQSVARYLWDTQKEGVQTKLINIRTPLTRFRLYMSNIRLFNWTGIQKSPVQVSKELAGLVGAYPSLQICRFATSTHGLVGAISKGKGELWDSLSLSYLVNPPNSSTLADPGLGLTSPATFKLVGVVFGDPRQIGNEPSDGWGAMSVIAPLMKEVGEVGFVSGEHLEALHLGSSQMWLGSINSILEKTTSLKYLHVSLDEASQEAESKKNGSAQPYENCTSPEVVSFFCGSMTFGDIRALRDLSITFPLARTIILPLKFRRRSIEEDLSEDYLSRILHPGPGKQAQFFCTNFRCVCFHVSSMPTVDHMSVALLLIELLSPTCQIQFHLDAGVDRSEFERWEAGVFRARDILLGAMRSKKGWRMLEKDEVVGGLVKV